MSRLSNCQLEALIAGIQKSVTHAAKKGRHSIAKQRQQRLDAYRAELQRRQVVGLNPSTEIQESHIVPVRPEAA